MLQKILSLIAASFFALLIVNVLAMGVLMVIEGTSDKVLQNSDRNPWIDRFGIELLLDVYPGKTEQEINEILNDTFTVRTRFYPLAQHGIEPISSRHLNVLEPGFRSVGDAQGPWPLDENYYNVFIFGGSTMFGAGVSDDETIARYLQDRLIEFETKDVRVYNFGTVSHFSSNERGLFEYLISQNFKPDMAIFLDGLNDMYFWEGIPVHTAYLQRAWKNLADRNWNHGWEWYQLRSFQKMPLGQLAEALVTEQTKGLMEFPETPDSLVRDPRKIKKVITRYISTVRMIHGAASAIGVKTLFVLQPVPFYMYPGYEQLLRDFGPFVGEHKRSFYGYPQLTQAAGESLINLPFVSCADISRDTKSRLYVDHVHYNAMMSNMVADCIASAITEMQR